MLCLFCFVYLFVFFSLLLLVHEQMLCIFEKFMIAHRSQEMLLQLKRCKFFRLYLSILSISGGVQSWWRVDDGRGGHGGGEKQTRIPQYCQNHLQHWSRWSNFSNSRCSWTPRCWRTLPLTQPYSGLKRHWETWTLVFNTNIAINETGKNSKF